MALDFGLKFLNRFKMFFFLLEAGLAHLTRRCRPSLSDAHVYRDIFPTEGSQGEVVLCKRTIPVDVCITQRAHLTRRFRPGRAPLSLPKSADRECRVQG